MRSQVLIVLALLCVSVAAKKYCGNDYSKLRDKTCTFAQEKSACLSPEDSKIRQKCCNKGCSMSDIQKACCFSEQCLNRCYPRRNRKQKLGEVY